MRVEPPLACACKSSSWSKRYWKEQQSWRQIIVVNGVTVIPGNTFCDCYKIKRVIFPDSVIRIEYRAFEDCKNLIFIKWSLCLEHIGEWAFRLCNLSSAFIPPACQEICSFAFEENTNLSILHIPENTQLGKFPIFNKTALAQAYPISNERTLAQEHERQPEIHSP